jgi:hypothetical protein
MDVISFLCASLGSSTVQLHDSLGSRGVRPYSEAGFGSQNGDSARGVLFVRFCGQKDSMQRIFVKKYFLFTVRSVCRVKRFSLGGKCFADDEVETEVRSG